MLTYFRNAAKSGYIKIVSVIIVLAIIGLSTVGNYGVSTDEAAQVRMVKSNFDLITKGQPIPSDSEYYGFIFNFSSEAIFQVKEIFR